jgi:PAS domain S-box-containing protein
MENIYTVDKKCYSESSDLELSLKILTLIDDDSLNTLVDYSTKNIGNRFDGIKLVNAKSVAEAKEIFVDNLNFALILINIGPRTSKNNMEFIDFVRENLNNQNVRIVVFADEKDADFEKIIFKKYNIDGFYYKSELNPERSFAIIKNCIQSFALIYRMENKITEEEHKYKTMFEYSSLPFHSLNSDGLIVDVNPMWVETLGYSRNEVIGKWFGDFMHPDYLDAFKTNFQDFKKQGIINDAKFILKKKNEVFIHVSLNGRIAYSPQGDMIKSYCVFKDISKERQMEDELDFVNNKFEEVVCNIPSAVWKIDFAKGNVFRNAYFSPVTEELLELPKASIRNSWKYVLNFVKPLYLEKIYAHFKEAIKSPEKAVFCDYEVINSKGEERWFQSQGRCFVENDKTHFFGSTIDITEQKRALERLKESEDDYRRLFERAHDAIIIMTPETEVVLDVNQRACNIYGFSRDEFIGMSILDISRNPSFGKEGILKTLETGVSHQFETSQYRKDSSVIYLEINASVCQYKGQKAILSINRDVTKRKIAEKAMQKSEEKFRLLAENSVECIWTTDSLLNFTYLSASLEKIVGFKPDEWIGTKISAHFDKTEFLKIGDIAMNTIENDKSFTNVTFESKIFNKNNEEVDLEITAAVLYGKNGEFIGLQGTSRDIRERRRSEKIQNVIFNISNAVNTSGNLEKLLASIQKELGSIIDTTNFYVALFEKQTNSFELPFITDQKITVNNFKARNTLTSFVLKTGKSLLVNKKKLEELKKSDNVISGGPEFAVWLGVPLKNNKNVIGVLAVQSYVDENAYSNSELKMLEFVSDQISISIYRKQTEQDLQMQNKEYAELNKEYKEINHFLRKAKDKAEESDKLKTAFLHNISHEIRTPMNGILGFANLLSEPGLTGQKQQSYVNIISTSGRRMLATLNDLMDMSMLETDQVKLNISSTNINHELTSLFNFFILEVEKKGLKLKFNSGLSNLFANIKTDRLKLYATLTNLIKNSIKYSHKGCIEFGYVKKENCIEFYVKDNGIGIPKHRQKAIFERFIQADIEDVRVYEGAGLGLSISKAYVELLGGEMWVESTEGKGSAFYFTLPYNLQKSQICHPHVNYESLILNTKFKNKLKILIAEDEEFADTYLSIVLDGISSEILHAKTGLDCVSLCRSNSDIDVILMDIKMPRMDGYDATKEIRKFDRRVKIIAQTAYALEGDREKALACGCNDYISKPIIANELLERISVLMD